MTPERNRYSPKPEDVLTEDEYETLQRAQQGELPCPECQTDLNGYFYFDVDRGTQIKEVRLSCPGCGFSEI